MCCGTMPKCSWIWRYIFSGWRNYNTEDTHKWISINRKCIIKINHLIS